MVEAPSKSTAVASSRGLHAATPRPSAAGTSPRSNDFDVAFAAMVDGISHKTCNPLHTPEDSEEQTYKVSFLFASFIASSRAPMWSCRPCFRAILSHRDLVQMRIIALLRIRRQ